MEITIKIPRATQLKNLEIKMNIQPTTLQLPSSSFTGRYQGFAQISGLNHKYPNKLSDTCPYADRIMMKITQNIINSKNSSELLIDFEKIDGKESMSMISQPSLVLKNMPFKMKLLRNATENLNNESFWRIISNPKVKTLKYSINQDDIKKMLDYFNKPKNYKDILTLTPEDPHINKRVKTFILSFEKYLSSDKEKTECFRKIFSFDI